ncbi:hypothetical protein Leryth_010144 [Lithospermum erythrorhizon]|nr:hypothetical protein Leryth_010144 [Lithospermum erythrorhizon]
MNKLKILTRPVLQTRIFCSSSSSFTIKNVTKSNFEAALTDLRGHVKGADFVAIDLEMTGVISAPWRESFDFDRFDIQYLKVKDSADKFAVVQFGVCPFRWDPLKASFIAHPYNFYIFPRQEIAGGPSPEFLCQTSSIDFLARYQFDFNMCIREGISYLSRSQEEEALRHLYSRYKYESPKSVHNLKEPTDTKLAWVSDILFSERMKNKVCKWRDSLLQDRGIRSECQPSSNNSSQNCQTTFFKSHPALVLDGFSSRQLHLIKMVTKKITDLEYICVPADTCCSQHLIVYTDSANDRELLRREVVDCLRDEAIMKIKAASGFRRVIDLLCTEQKLIVGHHCFLDIAHVYNKFIGPLPLTAGEYSARVQEYFPYIIDTKVLLNTSNVFQHTVKKSNTSLSKAFSLFCPQIASGVTSSALADNLWVKVEVQVDDQRSSNWNSGAKHEAGYDAFMTGCLFAQACSHLDVKFPLPHQLVELRNNEKLQKYVNHLYLSWKSGEIINLETGKISEESSAPNNHQCRYSKVLFANIVVLWGFPCHLKANDIRECLSKVFGPTCVTSIYNIDESAVFIQFGKEELVHGFLELTETLKETNSPISILHPLSKILKGGSTQAGNYDVYKEICSSPVSKVLFADQAEAVCVDWKTRLVKATADDSECLGNIEDKESALSVDQADESADLIYPVEAQSSK